MKKIKHILRARQAVAIAVLLSVCFGFMGVFIRMMGESFGNFQQVYLRVLLAGLLALIVFRPKRSKRLFSSLTTKEWTMYGLRALAAYTIGIASFTIAIRNADLGVVSLLSLLPTFGLLAFIMFGEKLPLSSIPFLILSLVGVFFLSGISLHNFHFGIGIITALIAGLGANVGFLMARLHKKERNNYENTTIVLLLGWIPVFVVSLLAHERFIPRHVSLAAIAGLALSVVLNIILLFMINYVFTNLKAYVAGNILLLEGVWSVIIGLVIYGEPVTMAIAIGALLVVASAVAINKIDDRVEEAPILPVGELEKTH